ncbi:MAG: glycosyltransferase family 1 protein [Proteobacteria bacterium]|nr:MAG: glycosyltransferase family 1 protein [Pseudomonadota bacterium]
MKVLHVEAGRHFYGGARQVAWLVEGLAQRGIANVLACPPGAAIGEQVGSAARVIEIPMRGDADAALAWRLARTIRSERPAIVHLAWLAGAPCVLSRRVDNPEPRWLVAIKYRLFDRVIAISEGIRDVLVSEGVAPERVRCVRSAVDANPWLQPVDRAAFLREFGLQADACVIGMIAQLIPRKGHRHLIAAIDALRRDFPALRVLLFGQGPLHGELDAEIGRRGLRETIRLAGFRNDLPRWVGGLDIVVHPAEMEGLGVSLLQASAAAVPIVASRAGGLPEAVSDGVSGLLVTPGDVPGLVEALRRLLDDPALRRRLGEAGRRRILSGFTIEAMVEGNIAVYREILAQRAGQTADRAEE